ncbi:anti-sigma factor RshA [Tsukamurella pulmonis]|uniref:Mycothiol system anti-sigma-R factor n=2 Tax=Tsukamurella pulmonis TaxID=47312 RepID=A0A1H1GRU3_9ACTN|nr:mycothiol system anti-sigma-R factor [Tsukamurella pulmonis]KXO88289.1 anti-sigma factor [Tsukamurella pulmonis]KXP13263.1 anti-sigma factor [Tsukamurella pulmonis]RDH12874.1 mycothiol system anti-sigma-R factor [Tsukamurella pulmonis]SDR15924.1 mycothiol system anti-sigma-R factor [Tsukamurella pulmonis]SUP16760.1 mycothiol system anti-sigma-R factor [Tsukamurella pulmonis]
MTYSSDGNPDLELDCSAVMADIWLLLDGECDDAAKERLKAHIDGCSQCLSHYGIEQQIKALVGRKCGGERAPEGLRERLTISIRHTEVRYRAE